MAASFLLLVSAFAPGAGAQEGVPVEEKTSEARLEDLAWLAGHWRMTGERHVAEEQWTRPESGSMLGVARVMAGGRTVFFEFLRIEARQTGGIWLAVLVKGAKDWVSFQLIGDGKKEAVFENLEHDFPQRIVYRPSETGLHAHVEGEVDGELQRSDFEFERAPAPDAGR